MIVDLFVSALFGVVSFFMNLLPTFTPPAWLVYDPETWATTAGGAVHKLGYWLPIETIGGVFRTIAPWLPIVLLAGVVLWLLAKIPWIGLRG